jgi:Uma2 family endonuclease
MAPVVAFRAEDLIDAEFDGIERYIINGELREYPSEPTDPITGDVMPVRNRAHALATTQVARLLGNWAADQPQPKPEVLTGDAGLKFDLESDTMFGVDLMVVSAEVMSRQTDASTIVVGVPMLAVEILSPSEPNERIDEKCDAYLDAGVSMVWLLDLHDRTVTVYQPGAEPVMFNRTQTLEAGLVLPGFRALVENLFR